MDKIKYYGRSFGQPRITSYILIWLMVVLVGGTVAQKYIGLYEAQRAFFNSFIMWIGPVPLPGGYPTFCILSINLVSKLIFASSWRKERIGTLISHAGVLLLLLGGMLTSAFSSEGSMLIYEGEASNYVSDYHIREFIISESLGEDREKLLAAYDWDELESGAKLTPPGLPFSVEVLSSYRNSHIFPRKTKSDNPELKGIAKDLDFKAAPLDTNDESNKYAVSFRINNAKHGQNGIYFSSDFIPTGQRLEIGEKMYNIILRKQKRVLPFSVELVKFHKEYHPATDVARSYRSDVIVKDGRTKWNSVIQMNKPLHYKGYILYQSSFVDEDGKRATVLAVVRNLGRMFPYISGIMMCIGLLIHLVIQLPRLIANRNAKVRQ